MAAPPFVAARVTPEMKTLLRMLAEREQITESALVRQLLEVTLRRSAMEGFPKLEALEKVSRDARLSISLAPDDRMLLTERATARGMRSATYVSVLVRAHLRQLAPLPERELAALRSTVNELVALGRNLNTMARLLQQDRRDAVPGRNEVQTMVKICEILVDRFRGLIRANLVSWDVGHAQKPR